jgi:hypothetical protein
MHQINLEVFTTKRDLWELESDRKRSLKQLNLQVQLNTIHENIEKFLSGIELLRARLNQNRTTINYLFH